MMFKVIGRMDGKNRVMDEEGKQFLLSESDLKTYERDHSRLSSQEKFPHEQVQLQVIQGGNPAYDLAFAQMVKRIEALEDLLTRKKTG